MFHLPQSTDALTQGDILEDCPLIALRPTMVAGPLDELPAQRWSSQIIVLTQACDLVQIKSPMVLVAPVASAQKLVDRGVMKATSVRDQVRRHQVFGWYFLPAASAPVDLPESLVDLRDIHSISRVILEELIARGKRVATLESPYREHLAQHFAVTYMRVALPEPYPTAP